MRAPLAAVAVAFGLGIGLAWRLQPSFLLLGCLLGALFLFLCFSRTPQRMNGSLIGLVIACGILRALCDAQVPADSVQRLLGAEPRPIACGGVIASDVEWTKPSQGQARRRAWFRVTEIQQRDCWIPACGRLLIHLPAVGPSPACGDRVRVHGSARAPRAQEAGTGFHEAQWLWEENSCGLLNVSETTGLVPIGSSGDLWSRYRRWNADFRHRLQEIGRSVTGAEDGAYLEALLLGEGRGIPARTADLFRKTGTIHILVVSGFQVGLIGLIGFTIFSLLRIPRAARILLVAVGLLLYCGLTGANPPILRATVTGILLCAGWYRGREISAMNSLAAAALLILFVHPRALADVSFQLSFAAVAGLLTLAPWLSRRWLGESPGSARRWLVHSAASSCGAWCAMTPVAAWHFHQVTPVALVANLILVPLSSLLIVTGFTLYVTAWVSPAAAAPFSAGFQALAMGLGQVVRWAAQCPGAFWSW